jgi:hypothetical protein
MVVTLIVVIRACILSFHKRSVQCNLRDAPCFTKIREMMTNTNYIYYSNDVEFVDMLRMRRVTFNLRVKMLRDRGCLKVASTRLSKS